MLIIADDFGVDSHGLYGVGSSAAPTPTINGIAAQGVRFNRAWANPVCSPTRATILTGRYSFRTGVGSAGGNRGINSAEYTVANALGTLGYSTALIGKWHLGTFNKPDDMGFDYYSGHLGGLLPDYFNWEKIENGVSTPTTIYATTENVNDAIDWIDGQETSDPDKPWFMWLAFNAPHDPFHKPPNHLHSYDTLSGTQSDIDTNTVPYYQAMVEAMDTEISRLLGTIDRTKTAIIFVGDNGTPPPATVAPADPDRVKGKLYEGGIWVPLIISDPSATIVNQENNAVVNSVDLFATIIEMAGGTVGDLVPSGVPIDSNSLLPMLRLPSVNTSCKYVVAEQFQPIGETPLSRDGKTIRNDTYKLIAFDLGGKRLHLLSNDPAQYPTDEVENLLDRALTPLEQANYDELSTKLASLISGNDTDRMCGSQSPIPNISASPLALAFGDVVTGTGTQQTATLSNTGSEVLDVSGVGISGNAAFTLVAPIGGFSIPVGGNQIVTVAFNPTTAGAHTGMLQVASNDPDQPQLNITLSGQGTSGGGPMVVYRLNAGGPAYMDTVGNLWSADDFFNTGKKFAVTAAISGTSDPTLYQTERYDQAAAPELMYTLPVSNGTYTVRLHFAEIFSGNAAPGSRIFGVNVEGTTLLSNYDIAADVGFRTATVKEFSVGVTDGNLNIQLLRVLSDPKISAIEVIGSPPGC